LSDALHHSKQPVPAVATQVQSLKMPNPAFQDHEIVGGGTDKSEGSAIDAVPAGKARDDLFQGGATALFANESAALSRFGSTISRVMIASVIARAHSPAACRRRSEAKRGRGRGFARGRRKRSDQLVDRRPKISFLRIGGKRRIKATEIAIDQDFVDLGARRNGVDFEALKPPSASRAPTAARMRLRVASRLRGARTRGLGLNVVMSPIGDMSM
jgi:hypothetical protein